MKAWEILYKAGSAKRADDVLLSNLSSLINNNRLGVGGVSWDLEKFQQVFTKLIRDFRPGTVVTHIEESIDELGVVIKEDVSEVVGRTLNEAEMANILTILNTTRPTGYDAVLKELCCESSWKFVGAEMVLRTAEKQKIWGSIEAFERFLDGRYIDIYLNTGKRIEVKSWIKIYPKTFINQFINKDLASIVRLQDLEWVFDAKYPEFLKDDILTVLKSTKGKEALNRLFTNGKLQSFFPPNIVISNVDDFITQISNDELFNKIFSKY